MKEFLFVHDVPADELRPNSPGVLAGNYIQNVARTWLDCFHWQEGQAECIQWQKVTPEKCSEFRWVMFWVLTEPGNAQKYEKMLATMRAVNERYPETETIVYADGPVGWGYQMNSLPLGLKGTFLALCREARWMFCYSTPQSMPYWRAVRDGEDVFAINRPHPIHEAEKLATPRGTKYKAEHLDIPWEIDFDHGKWLRNAPRGPWIAMAKGVNNINEERGVFCSARVAKHVQDIHGLSVICHTVTPCPEDGHDYYKELLGLDRVIEIRLKPWKEYMKDLSRAMLAVHLDVLETRGQFALDCATVGIPCVASGSVAGQKLFPAIYLDHPREIDRACVYADRLLNDAEFYERVMVYAKTRLEEYRCAAVRKKFDDIVAHPQPVGGQA